MKKALLLLLTFASLTSLAQDLTFYTMQNDGINIDPAAFPKKKFYVSMPLLSSINLRYSNSGFKYYDLYKKQSNDSVKLDFDNVISNLNKNNLLNLHFSNTLFFIGYNTGTNYFTFGITEKADVNFNYPESMMELLNNGNASQIGSTIDMQNLNVNATHYREYALGFSRKISDKLIAGYRLKYLYGMDNVSTSNKNLSIYTSPDDYALTLQSDVTINTSTPGNTSDGFSDIGAYLLRMKNRGYGFDMSFHYMLNEKWNFSASAIDVGFIDWKSNLKNYTINSGAYTFNGINLNDLSGNGGPESQLDTLSEIFSPTETQNSYRTSLPFRVFTTAEFKLNKNVRFTALAMIRNMMGVNYPSATIAYNHQLGKHFSTVLSYSYTNGNYNNIGTGIEAKLGGFRMYFVTDNIFGIVNPMNVNTADLRTGINFAFGSPKVK